MKRIQWSEFRPLLIRSRHVLGLTVTAWDFHAGFEPELYGDLAGCLIDEVRIEESSAPEGYERLGYFSVPATISEEKLMSLATDVYVRMFISPAIPGALRQIPEKLQETIGSLGEFDEALLGQVCSIGEFDWLALRDGDAGDEYYYLFGPLGNSSE